MTGESTEVFLKHRNQIRKAAWGVARTFRFDPQETISDGYFLFLTALEKYDPSYGVTFSTFLHQHLRGIADLHFRENKDIIHFDYTDMELPTTPALSFTTFQKELEFHECVETELSEDAREVLAYILANPEKRHTQNSILNHFHGLKAWKVKQAEEAFGEIQTWWACFNAA